MDSFVILVDKKDFDEIPFISYNTTGKYSSLEKISADLNIYASKNNPTAPSNINFY